MNNWVLCPQNSSELLRTPNELDYLTVCEKVKADIFVIGEDWGGKPHNKDVENYFRKIVVCPLLSGERQNARPDPYFLGYPVSLIL